MQRNIKEMQNLDGIGMIPDLHFLYMEIMVKLKDIMYFMLLC